MKKIFILSSLIAVTLATPSFAEPTELDKKTVASKAYVDTKQDIIETDLVTFREPEEQIDYTVPSLVSYGTGTNNADGVLGNKIGILGTDQAWGGLYSYDFLDMEDDESVYLDNFVPTVRAVAHALEPVTWDQLNTTNMINTYRISFADDDTNKLINGWFLAHSLALKQNKIDAQNTSLVPGQQVGNGVPSSVIAATAIPGVVQQVALWDADSMDPSSWDLEVTYGVATEITAIRQSIPTVGAVAAGLNEKQNKLRAKSTGNAAPKGNQVVVLNAAGHPSNVYTTAGKDLALTAKSGAEKVMNYIDGTTASATFATSQGLTEAQVKSALVSLELLKDVYSELNAKITNNALPTGTTGAVVTYNGTNQQTGVQEFGERAVYDPANAYNAQNDATKLATMASVKYECAGYEAGHENDPDYCWLWALPN